MYMKIFLSKKSPSQWALALAALPALLSSPSLQAAEKKITICVPEWREELLTAQILVAKDKGFFKDLGAEVELKAMLRARGMPDASDRGVLKSVVSDDGACQFGSTTIENLLVSGIAADKVIPLQFHLYGESYDTHLVVSKRSGIKSVAELKGRKIRLGQIPTQIAMEQILKEAGLGMKDVEIVRGIAAVDTLAALERGEVDAAITYNPSMPLMLSSGKVEILKKNIMRGYVMNQVPHSFVAVSPKFASANGELVAKFSQALRKADEYVAANPSELIYSLQRNAKSLRMPEFKVDPVLAERAGDLFGDVHMTETDAKVVQSVEGFQELLMKKGFVSRKTDFGSWKKLGPKKVASR